MMQKKKRSSSGKGRISPSTNTISKKSEAGFDSEAAPSAEPAFNPEPQQRTEATDSQQPFHPTWIRPIHIITTAPSHSACPAFASWTTAAFEQPRRIVAGRPSGTQVCSCSSLATTAADAAPSLAWTPHVPIAAATGGGGGGGSGAAAGSAAGVGPYSDDWVAGSFDLPPAGDPSGAWATFDNLLPLILRGCQ